MGFSFVSLKNITVHEINGSLEADVDAFPGTPCTLRLRRKSGMLPKSADVVIIGPAGAIFFSSRKGPDRI
ncbi:MAG: hypothetical protein P8175_13445 [Deltaproteobacteria bacterium]